ncbi:MAG: hypothetical protein ACRDLM_10335 [Gaiellaceae bacterium]
MPADAIDVELIEMVDEQLDDEPLSTQVSVCPVTGPWVPGVQASDPSLPLGEAERPDGAPIQPPGKVDVLLSVSAEKEAKVLPTATAPAAKSTAQATTT